MTATMANGADILIRAAKTAEGRGTFTAEDMEDLEAVLQLRTLDAVHRDPDRALEIASEFPGYLVRMVDEDRVFVPFNLAAVSPRLQQLRVARDVACSVRLAATNAICLSGSGATLGKVETVADLDFCEYHLGTDLTLAEGVRAKTKGQPPLIWVKRPSEKKPVCAPWADLPRLLEGTLDAIKLDFVSNSALGVLPTTTLVLKTSGEDGAAGKSFAYQEAVVGGADPVRALINPERLGAYIWWLKTEAPALLRATEPTLQSKKAVKALKRCLSLYLMVEKPEIADDILSRLGERVVHEVVLGSRLKELKEMAEAMSSPPVWLNDAITTLGQAAKLPEQEHAIALQAVETLADGLVLKIDAMFEETV